MKEGDEREDRWPGKGKGKGKEKGKRDENGENELWMVFYGQRGKVFSSNSFTDEPEKNTS